MSYTLVNLHFQIAIMIKTPEISIDWVQISYGLFKCQFFSKNSTVRTMKFSEKKNLTFEIVIYYLVLTFVVKTSGRFVSRAEGEDTILHVKTTNFQTRQNIIFLSCEKYTQKTKKYRTVMTHFLVARQKKSITYLHSMEV